MKQSIMHPIRFLLISFLLVYARNAFATDEKVSPSSNGRSDGLFTCIRYLLKNGWPFLLKPMDPLSIERYTWKSEHYWLYGTYDFHNVTFTGLSKFNDLGFSYFHLTEEEVLRITCKLAFNLKISGGYRITDGVVFDIAPINGHGNFTMGTSPVELDLTMNFNSSCPKLHCFNDAHLAIKMESNVNITGLEPSPRMSKLISLQLSSIIDDLFNHNPEIVDAIIDPFLNSSIEAFVSFFANIPIWLKPLVNFILGIIWSTCSK